MTNRKGPSESATKFKKGTKKRGNNGNMWIIVTTSSGTQRWQKINVLKKKNSTKKTKKMNKVNNLVNKIEKSCQYIYIYIYINVTESLKLSHKKTSV